MDHTSRPSPSCNLWRSILVGWGIVLLTLTAGFILQAPWATTLWPWPDGRLTYIFVGSVLAAIALPVIWIGSSGELAAQRAGALDLALCFAGITATFVYLVLAGQTGLRLFMLIAFYSLLLNLGIFGLARSTPFTDKRPTPAMVRWSFILFAVLLLGVGACLLAQLPFIFPWPLKPETSMLVGWIFLGAAIYFLYAVKFPYWANARGQLMGFLAYDLVLLVPFLAHLDNVKEEHWLSLVVYLGVLTYSFALAVFFLFLHPSTRFGSARITTGS